MRIGSRGQCGVVGGHAREHCIQVLLHRPRREQQEQGKPNTQPSPYKRTVLTCAAGQQPGVTDGDN